MHADATITWTVLSLLALVLSWVGIWTLRRHFAPGFMDLPNRRSSHTMPTPQEVPVDSFGWKGVPPLHRLSVQGFMSSQLPGVAQSRHARGAATEPSAPTRAVNVYCAGSAPSMFARLPTESRLSSV